MQRILMLGHEDAIEKILGDHRIDLDAFLRIVVEVGFALDGNERADFSRRQHHRGLDDFLKDLGFLKNTAAREHRTASEMGQSAADIVLENNHHDDDEVGDKLFNKPVRGRQVQVLLLADEKEDADDQEPKEHLDGTGPFDKLKHTIDDSIDECEIEENAQHSRPSVDSENVENLLHQSGSNVRVCKGFARHNCV